MTSHLKKPLMNRSRCRLAYQCDGKIDTAKGQTLHQVLTGVRLQIQFYFWVACFNRSKKWRKNRIGRRIDDAKPNAATEGIRTPDRGFEITFKLKQTLSDRQCISPLLGQADVATLALK